MSANPEKRIRLGRERRGRPGNARMDGRPVRRHPERGPRARPLPARATARTRPPEQHRQAVLGQHRLRQHHRAGPGRALPRQPRDRRAPARLHALERDGDGGQGQPPAPARRRRPGRPHRLLRLAGQHVRRRLQPLLARREREATAATCSTSRATSRPASTPAPTWKAASPKSSCSTSARKSTARACRATRTRS